MKVTGLYLLISVATALSAQSVAINPSGDNTLYGEGGLSNGGGDHFFAGTTNNTALRRGLLIFNIAGNVPADATIESVTLTLFLSRSRSMSHSVSLHRVSKQWGEGTAHALGQEGAGAPANPSDATWTFASFPVIPWQFMGGDFNLTPSASLSVSGIGFYTWATTPQLVADVQNMLDNPTTNYGWALVGNEAVAGSSKRFDSRENPTAMNRPLLTINYTEVPVELQSFTIE